jgi:hypothetical protein
VKIVQYTDKAIQCLTDRYDTHTFDSVGQTASEKEKVMSLVARLVVAVAVLLFVGFVVTSRTSPVPEPVAGPPGCCAHIAAK